MLARLLKANPLVVTGLGCVSAAGDSPAALWAAACRGEGLAQWLPIARRGQPESFAGCGVQQIPEISPLARKMDRSAKLALAAAAGAWREAGLDALTPERISIIAGTSRGAVGQWRGVFGVGPAGRQRPSAIANTSVANLSGLLSLHFHTRGPALTVSATCASSAAAITLAAQQLLLGEADAVLAGGAEAPLEPVVLEQFDAARLLGSAADAAQACRPFDATRDGTVLGEGAGFLVLETLAAAQRRGARPLARLAGWFIGAEGRERAGMDSSGEGLARVLREALALAGLAPAQVGYLNLHGTGTPLNDLAEAQAVRAVFGDSAMPGCSSTKPVTGHCMGAAAALEAIISIAALRQQLLPPSANCAQPDPACAIDLVRGPARAAKFQSALSLSSGFWGNQGALVFSAV